MPLQRCHHAFPTLTAALLLLASGACDKSPAPASSGAATPPVTPTQAAPVAASPAAGPKGDVKVVEGSPPGADERYDLQIDTPAAKAGEQAQVTVRVVPKAPWHMNLDFPTSLKLEAPEQVTLAKADLTKSDAVRFDESTCEFAVQFTPTAAGEQAFSGKFKFAVCQDEACSPVTKDVEFKVAVK